MARLTFRNLCGPFAFSQPGIEFDGKYLWHTCFTPVAGRAALVASDPRTGKTVARYFVKTLGLPSGEQGLGGLTYDWANDVLYAGSSTTCGRVYRIQLDAAHRVESARVAFTVDHDFLTSCANVGLAYDEQAENLYYADSSSQSIHVYRPNGAYVRSFPWAGRGKCANGVDGLAIGGNLLFEGSGDCDHIYVVNKITNTPAFDFSTRYGGTGSFRDADLSCDNHTFRGMDVLWSKEAFAPIAYAFKVPRGTCDLRGALRSPVITASAIEKGSSIAYRLGFRSTGGSTIKRAQVLDPAPGGTTVVKIRGGRCGHSVRGGIATFCIGTLNPSQDGSLRLWVRLDRRLPRGHDGI